MGILLSPDKSRVVESRVRPKNWYQGAALCFLDASRVDHITSRTRLMPCIYLTSRSTRRRHTMRDQSSSVIRLKDLWIAELQV